LPGHAIPKVFGSKKKKPRQGKQGVCGGEKRRAVPNRKYSPPGSSTKGLERKFETVDRKLEVNRRVKKEKHTWRGTIAPNSLDKSSNRRGKRTL